MSGTIYLLPPTPYPRRFVARTWNFALSQRTPLNDYKWRPYQSLQLRKTTIILNSR
jgi:hypothetical protein